MRISIIEPGGIIPRRDPEALPDNGAQTALNVDLTSGRWEPINISDTEQWHDETNRISNIAAADFFQVGTPDAVTLASTSYIFQRRLVNVEEFVYVTYVDSNGDLVVEKMYSYKMIPKRAEWTSYGTRLYFSKRKSETRTFSNDGLTYRIYGPRLRIRYGGNSMPLTDPTFSDPIFPAGAIPLLNPNDNDEQYGSLTVQDYSGPVFDDEVIVINTDNMFYSIPAHGFTLDLNLNYIYNTRRTFYYVQTEFKSGVSPNYEGPASDLSEPIIVDPGTEVTLNVVSSGNLYRSETGGDDFLLIDTLDNTTLESDNGDGTGTYVDRRQLTLGTVLPVYGDYPDSATAVGSVVHPAGWAAIFKDNVVYPSDVDMHSTYPAEWAVEFRTNVMALEIQGGTILVWTAAGSSPDYPGKVFALQGSDPSSLQKVELSATEPLLDARSICKVGQNVYYVSYNGLMEISGGGPHLVTEPFYTQVEWNALTPASFKAKVWDNSVLLYGSSTNLRIDLDEQLTRVTTWDALTGASLTWKSKIYVADRPWRPTCARVRAANYPVTLRVYAAGSGTPAGSFTVSDGNSFRLGRYRRERLWELQIESAYAVDEVSLATSMEELKHGAN